MESKARVQSPSRAARHQVASAIVRFAGDSGDGMQLAGSQFTQATALMGNDLATFPDFPAEIRAPAGTLYGVSGFQIHFASHDVLTPGDRPDVLVAMNPAALKVNLGDLREGALVIANSGAFTRGNLEKAGYSANPLEDDTLGRYRLLSLDITKLTLDAVTDFGLSAKEAGRCKNMWALGLLLFMYDRETASTASWLEKKFAKSKELAQANIAALKAGHAYGETVELPGEVALYEVPKAELEPGLYRNVNGNQATAWGLVAGAKLAGLPLFYGSYPITPASTLLHSLATMKQYGVTTFQAEDEIAAACAAIGASYGGAIGVCASSGPGVVLKTEAIGLAIATELPLLVVDVQRAGPSTGMPTKTEQSDLLMAIYGRNGDAPMPVLAAATPGDCFYMAIEALRIATKYMTPVLLLTDGYIANGAEPWKIPDIDQLVKFEVHHLTDPTGFHPFRRDETTLARNWAVPGTPGLAHRIGGIERSYDSGHISYDPDNHQRMTRVRAQKVANVARDIPEIAPELGDGGGALAVVSWGSTFGSVKEAVRLLRTEGCDVSHIHLRYLWPLQRGLGPLLRRFDRVVVPELNNGMLVKVLRSEYLVDAVSISQVTGRPFRVHDLTVTLRDMLEGKGASPLNGAQDHGASR